MLGQTSVPDEKASTPFQVERDQSASTQDAATQRTIRFLWTSLGCAVLMLIGVSVCALQPSAKPSTPSMHGTGGFMPGMIPGKVGNAGKNYATSPTGYAPAAQSGLHQRAAQPAFSRARMPQAMESGGAAYRLLGLAEDATYDEVQAAYNELSAKYEGNMKLNIKLQVAKDEIMNDRLRAVTSGRFKSRAPISELDKAADQQDASKPLITIPPAMQGFMELPTKFFALRNAGVFGVLGILPLLSTSFAPTSVFGGLLIGVYLLYNRGVETSKTSRDIEGTDTRQIKPKPIIKTVGITLLAGAIGATLSPIGYRFVRRIFSQEIAWISLCTNAAFWVSTSLLKVQTDL